MSKVIYYDVNGNETEYGGTINNAELLPMSALDPTSVANNILLLQENNLLKGTITSGSSIRSVLVDTNIKKGVYYYQAQNASDNPESGTLALALIYKHNANGNYSRVYVFVNSTIYLTSVSSSVPATLTWSVIADPSTEDITSLITFNETVTGTNTRFYCKNNVVYMNYQGESKTHSAGDVLFNLPSGYRPLNLLYTPFVVNGATFGNFEIAKSGQAKINQINDSTATGRIYATVSFPII